MDVQEDEEKAMVLDDCLWISSAKCMRCTDFYAHFYGYCSLCYKEVHYLDNYGIETSTYRHAISESMTELTFLTPQILSFICYPKEYYHDKVKHNISFRSKQLLLDDWYQYSQSKGKLKSSIHALTFAIRKLSADEFIHLLCTLQPWMRAQQVCDIVMKLPPVDDTLIRTKIEQQRVENVRKIVATVYFGTNFIENNGVYFKRIVELLKQNRGGSFLCYKFYGYAEQPHFGRHPLLSHVSERYKSYQSSDIDDYYSIAKPPGVRERELMSATTLQRKRFL
eukprot:1002581_1